MAVPADDVSGCSRAGQTIADQRQADRETGRRDSLRRDLSWPLSVSLAAESIISACRLPGQARPIGPTTVALNTANRTRETPRSPPWELPDRQGTPTHSRRAAEPAVLARTPYQLSSALPYQSWLSR